MNARVDCVPLRARISERVCALHHCVPASRPWDEERRRPPRPWRQRPLREGCCAHAWRRTRRGGTASQRRGRGVRCELQDGTLQCRDELLWVFWCLRSGAHGLALWLRYPDPQAVLARWHSWPRERQVRAARFLRLPLSSTAAPSVQDLDEAGAWWAEYLRLQRATREAPRG